MVFFSLFISSFLAATLFPGGSELALLAAIQQQWGSISGLFLAATLGNTLGGLVTVWMGQQASRIKPAQQLARSPRQQKALAICQRWGSWTLMLSWLPVVGDLICLVAGWLKLPWLPVIWATLVGKAMRYAILIWLWQTIA